MTTSVPTLPDTTRNKAGSSRGIRRSQRRDAGGAAESRHDVLLCGGGDDGGDGGAGTDRALFPLWSLVPSAMSLTDDVVGSRDYHRQPEAIVLRRVTTSPALVNLSHYFSPRPPMATPQRKLSPI